MIIFEILHALLLFLVIFAIAAVFLSICVVIIKECYEKVFKN